MYDVIVVGCGFAGAVFARELADSGKNVIIIERRNHIGGNAYEDFSQNKIRVHRYGPHIFHTSNKQVFDYLSNFTEWYSYNHKVIGDINKKLVPFPINFKSIELLFEPQKACEIKQKLEQHFGLNTKVSVFDLINSAEQSIKDFGQFVFDNMFKNYTAKQWGVAPEKVSRDAINRVPVIIGYNEDYFSDSFQFMPKDGFTKLFENMLDHNNITVRLNTDAKQVLNFDFETNKIMFENEVFNGKLLLSCALDYLLDYRFGTLPYRTLDMRFEDIATEFFQPNSVVNYPNEHDYTRITEFKYLTGQQDEKNTTVLKEYPLEYTKDGELEPFYPINNAQNDALYAKYKQALSGFENIILCGRLSQYSYFNMDKVVENALELAFQHKQNK